MGTEVLRPQDCLNHRLNLPVALPRGRWTSSAANPPKSGRKAADYPSLQKKQQVSRRQTEETPFAGKSTGRKATAKNMTMGQVTILKRGQSLDSVMDRMPLQPPTGTKESLAGDLIVSTTDRLGPDPSFIPRQIGLTAAAFPRPVYAGSAFSLSPSPSSLPLPTFSVKKCFEDSATKDLRRLLRLD